jgi:hypothetical protein
MLKFFLHSPAPRGVIRSETMRNWLCLTLAAGALHAAVIRGNVVENLTGHPLARAAVALQPVGAGAAPQSVRSNAYGAFEFPSLPAGVYLISAVRLAFAPVQYGQKRWLASGIPITLNADESTFLTIRLPRYGAIAGTLLDENEVGLPDQEVAVYTTTRPPRLLARARTDDRGMYRLFGLQPGAYLVRSMAKLYEDGGYLPTFYRDSPTVDQARSIEVLLDQQVDRVDVHPTPGRLYSVSGRVYAPQFGQSVVALASDTGTEFATVDSAGNFSFNPMAPGQYELLAQGPPDRYQPPTAAYQPLTVDRDLTDLNISLRPLPAAQFVFEDAKGQPLDSRQLKVMARRKDIAGDAKTETLQVVFDGRPPVPPGARNARRPGAPPDPDNDALRAVSGKVALLPGRWDVALAPSPVYCVVDFTPPQPGLAESGRADGWNEILLAAGAQNVVKFVLSSKPAALSGTVKNSGGDPVAGVPVFLEPFDQDPRRRLAEIRATRANAQGQYRFGGLAPGVYRLLGTFDYQMPDSAGMEAARAKTVKVEEGSGTVLDLDEFVIH